MSTATKTNRIRIYTNDLERERLRQAGYAMTPNRLSLNRHRTRRAGERQLFVIALIARERKDETLYREVRKMLALEPTDRVDELVDIVESRRPTRAQRHAFASNRMLRQHVFESARQLRSFPLQETPAKVAADLDRIA